MKNRLLMTTAAIALIAGTGLATAQDRKEGAAPNPAPAAQQNAPAEKMSPPAAQRGNDRGAMDKSHGGSSARPDAKADMKSDSKSSTSAQAPTSAGDKRVEGDMKSSNKTDMKADSKSNMKASDSKASDSKSGTSATQNSAQTKPDSKSTTSTSQTTTGQGAAGARSVNLTSEQKTTIKTVIKEQKVAPVTNVNFSISVGTRIPREVRHHPLPARIVEVYPAWRGFEYILVRDEILVINPNTLEIVAIIDA